MIALTIAAAVIVVLSGVFFAGFHIGVRMGIKCIQDHVDAPTWSRIEKALIPGTGKQE